MAETGEIAGIEKLRELALGDLYVFAKGILGFDWLNPEIHGPLCRLLELYGGWNASLAHPRADYEAVLRDKHIRPRQSDKDIERILTKGLKRLGIILPRSWLKTTVCSIAYPMWRAARDKNFRALLAQNTFKNACSKNKVIKTLFEKGSLFQALFPALLPRSDCTWAAESLCVNRDKPWAESTFEAAGTRTQVTSRHYDVINQDDTVAPDKDDLGEDALMPSKQDIEQAIGWHKLVPPLLLDPMDSQELITATRWYVEDLVAWVQAHEKEFVWYMRACREDAEGNPDPRGEVQYKQRFSDEVLESLESRLGPYLFSCLYLNTPLRTENMVFKPEWIHYGEQWPRSVVCFTSVDPAGISEDETSDSDYNTVVTCGKDLITGRIFVLEYFHERCTPSEVIQAIFEQAKRWKPVKVKIETVAYQSTLAYWVREQMTKEGFYFVIETCPHPKGAKPARIRSLQPLFAAGMVILRPHMQALVNELLAFPFGKHDDLIDALAAQLEMWQATIKAQTRSVPQYADDPMNVDAAVVAFKQARKKRKSFVGDVADVQDVLVMN